MTHMKIAQLSLFILLTYSFTVKQKQIKTKEQLTTIVQTSNLGFIDYKGTNTTPAQVSSFINFINSASTFIRSDANQRLAYISDKMNAAYGQGGKYGFTVLLGSYSSQWSIYSFGVYASVAAGVDLIFPNASYIFIRNDIFPAGRTTLKLYQIGDGLVNLLPVIQRTILAYDDPQECTCNTRLIMKSLNQYDGKYWNVFCSATPDLFGVVYSYNNKYIYTRPNLSGCYYAIHVTS